METIGLRSARGWYGLGALLVVAAGCVLLAATFLPWTSLPAQYVDGGSGIQSFSGWDLVTKCEHRSFPGQCVVEDPSPSPEFVADHVVAGDWSLLAGALLIIIGLVIVPLRSRDRWSGVLIVSGWVVGLLAMLCGIAMLVEFIGDPNGPGSRSVEIGAWIALGSPVVALVGIALVQTARARERAARSDVARRSIAEAEYAHG